MREARPLVGPPAFGRAMMQRVGDEVHLDDDEARSGSTPHVVRWMLIFGLLLAVLAMSAIWVTRAIHEQPRQGDPVTAEEHALGS